MKKHPPSAASRYFIGIIPPSPVHEEVQSLQNCFKEQYQSQAALKAPPHITLYRPFFWSDKDEGLLVSLLTPFFLGQEPTTIELLNFSSFPPRVIFIDVANNEKLNKLQRELERFCKITLNLSDGDEDLPYRPHMTLAFRDLKKPMFARAWQQFAEMKFRASFVLDKTSLLKHNGHRWEPYRDFHF